MLEDSNVISTCPWVIFCESRCHDSVSVWGPGIEPRCLILMRKLKSLNRKYSGYGCMCTDTYAKYATLTEVIQKHHRGLFLWKPQQKGCLTIISRQETGSLLVYITSFCKRWTHWLGLKCILLLWSAAVLVNVYVPLHADYEESRTIYVFCVS